MPRDRSSCIVSWQWNTGVLTSERELRPACKGSMDKTWVGKWSLGEVIKRQRDRHRDRHLKPRALT